jgi:RNA recognition motif-containing protein
MLTSSGSSPSIIEFASREDAQRAINEFSDKPLLGRPVFIREASSLLPFVAARPPSAR